jgi:pyruvate dehydrogenase E2 component (dihydrolipoamide acetyltransferase)
MPDLGEGLVEARVIALYVAAGDDVAEDQPLGAFETDKALVDIPCPWSGKIKVLFCSVGQVVKVGSPVAEFEVLDCRRLRS